MIMKNVIEKKASSDSPLCTDAQTTWPERNSSTSETKWKTMPRLAACRAMRLKRSLVRVSAKKA